MRYCSSTFGRFNRVWRCGVVVVVGSIFPKVYRGGALLAFHVIGPVWLGGVRNEFDIA